MTEELCLRNVQVAYGKNQVLKGLNARIQPGRVYGLLGLNGAGKSTLFHAIVGLLPCTGSITFGGEPVDLAADEPHNGLDPQGIKDLRLLIRRLAHEGKTVMISSHQLGEVAHMVDDIGIIAHGRMHYEGPLEAIADSGASLRWSWWYRHLAFLSGGGTPPSSGRSLVPGISAPGAGLYEQACRLLASTPIRCQRLLVRLRELIPLSPRFSTWG